MSWLKNIFNILTVDISVINRQVFSLPLKNISSKEIVFNKHMQNLIWTFWFGELLHKDN